MIQVTRYYYEEGVPSFILSDDTSGSSVTASNKDELFKMIVCCFKAMTVDELEEFLARQLRGVMASQQSVSALEIERDGVKIEVVPLGPTPTQNQLPPKSRRF